MIDYKKIVESLKERIIAELGDRIDSIVLYGSTARNETTKDSDIDILIVTQDDDKEVYDVISKIRTHIDMEHNTLTSLVHLSRRELKNYFKRGSPFIANVAEEGIILYDIGIFKGIRKSIVA